MAGADPTLRRTSKSRPEQGSTPVRTVMKRVHPPLRKFSKSNPNFCAEGPWYGWLWALVTDPAFPITYRVFPFAIIVGLVAGAYQYSITSDLSKLFMLASLVHFAFANCLIQVAALLVKVTGALQTRCFPRPVDPSITVTVIQPLCGNEAGGLFKNLTAIAKSIELASQRCRGVEWVLSVSNQQDPAYELAKQAVSEFGKRVDVRLVLSDPERGFNAKLNNLYTAYESSTNEWVVFVDSSTRPRSPEWLSHLISHCSSDPNNTVAGIATYVHIVDSSDLWGYLEQMILNTYVVNGFIWSHIFLPHPYRVLWGKNCIVNRHVLDSELEGLESFKNCFNEDTAMGGALQNAGFRIKMVASEAYEVFGERRLRDLWSRQLRWGMMRRAFTPFVTAAEFINSAFFACLTAHFAFPQLTWVHHIGLGLLPPFTCHYLSFLLIELKWIPLFPFFVVLWLAKEMFILFQYPFIMLTKYVTWRGKPFLVDHKCMLQQVE